jgi:hypothetical protein
VQLRPDRLQITRGLRERVLRTVEVVEVLGAVRLRGEEIGQVEAELLGELADLCMALVDQLAAVLGYLAGEIGRAGPAAAADAAGRLMDLRTVARLLEPVSARQPGETGSDDNDSHGRSRSRPLHPAPGRRQAEPGDPCVAQEPPPSETLVEDLLHRNRAGFCLAQRRNGVLQPLQQRGARHLSPFGRPAGEPSMRYDGRKLNGTRVRVRATRAR